MNNRARVRLALLTLRVSIFTVMLVWTLDKFINPSHAASVYEHFYFIGGLGRKSFILIGALEFLLLFAFLAGYRKRLTYGLVLLLHAVSTFSSYRQYLDPFENLLFFAALPMLAACFTLYYLRELDTKWAIA